MTSKLVVSPEDNRPYPEALPRKQTGKGRPKGKSLILTDTTEKQRIESQKLGKASKGVKKVTRVFNPKVVKKKLTYPSSSELDVDEPDNLCADEGLSDEDFADLEDADNKNIVVGCFILVKICSKKTVKYFAAEIISLSECFYEVKYLMKDVNSQKFTRQDPETYELEKMMFFLSCLTRFRLVDRKGNYRSYPLELICHILK